MFWNILQERLTPRRVADFGGPRLQFTLTGRQRRLGLLGRAARA